MNSEKRILKSRNDRCKLCTTAHLLQHLVNCFAIEDSTESISPNYFNEK